MGKETRHPNALHRLLAIVLALVAIAVFVVLIKRPGGEPVSSTSAQPSTPAPIATPTASVEPEVFGARHVLVQYTGSQRAPVDLKRTKDEAKKRAEEVAGKAGKLMTEHKDVDARAKAFAVLVTEYSDEPGAGERGGELGRFRLGGIDPAFGAAVAKMKKGEVSGVVETPFGFHVILRTY